MVTDGDPNDTAESSEAAAALAEAGAKLHFLRAGANIRGTAETLERLSSATFAQGDCNSSVIEAPVPGRRVEPGIPPPGDLLGLVPEVLGRVVHVSQSIRRVRCAMPLYPYTVAEDVDKVDGLELRVRDNWVSTEAPLPWINEDYAPSKEVAEDNGSVAGRSDPIAPDNPQENSEELVDTKRQLEILQNELTRIHAELAEQKSEKKKAKVAASQAIARAKAAEETVKALRAPEDEQGGVGKAEALFEAMFKARNRRAEAEAQESRTQQKAGKEPLKAPRGEAPQSPAAPTPPNAQEQPPAQPLQESARTSDEPPDLSDAVPPGSQPSSPAGRREEPLNAPRGEAPQTPAAPATPTAEAITAPSSPG